MKTKLKKTIDWTKQHGGVRHAPIEDVIRLMPDLEELLGTFPDNPQDFAFDVKVHMLMPGQFPCIPNWHYDHVPRENGIQRFDQTDPKLPMYLWLSGPPLTQFQHGYVRANVWHRFSQLDVHRGCAANDFGWRGFVRAVHKDIYPPNAVGTTEPQRHVQVYCNADTIQW